ncbi:low choriolytic enzyme-like isoform X2 [Alosa sapidissima]|uniref:low choriolytic enzyme-like isoform X2 n=1 Tax=Alosa sapidissima TaxID=34773 RepID=UPI001C080D49|nr:low choriolytic enzyme-like isoform X2 [Alosa sapidissima]
MDTSAVILLVLLLGTLNTVQCQYEEAKSEDVEEGGPLGLRRDKFSEEDNIVSNLIERATDKKEDDIPEEEKYTVSGLIERASKNAGQALDDPEITEGDIAVYTGFQNADPCTSHGCKWPRARDGLVYVPYYISNQYSSRERATIERGLQSFAQSTCIRFRRRTRERDYVHIQSRSGCWSFVGRRGGEQILSLDRRGCVYHMVIQHELLHALGFNHEQCRSDRDQHVYIYYQNIVRGLAYAFNKINTNNLGTPYDYGSVMHYGRYAFSANRQPTIVPIPNANVQIGRATQMSRMDILRVQRLYGCK